MPKLLRDNRLLWTLQILLAALYLFAGGFKLVAAPDAMRASPSEPIPPQEMVAFLRMIGAFEVLGALGLILPGLFRVRRHLTSVAAGCLAIIMVGAVVTSIVQLGVAAAILPFVVGVLDVVVMRGRRNWDVRARPVAGV
jgi:hypothetical protein